MKALRLHERGDLRLHDEPEPTPADGELLLRVTAVGLCGSDLHWFEDGSIGDAVLTRPLVLGHEFAATVAAGPRQGQRVALDPANPCGRCAPCLAGDENLCLDVRFAGHGAVDGALRSLMTWPEQLAHPVPDSVSDDEAALLEPLGVALHALDLGHVRAGMRAGVYGCGPLGLLLVQVLRLAGAEVVASEPLAHRLAAAEALGADTGAANVDVAFEVAGNDEALAHAVDELRPGGRLVVVGIPSNDRMCLTASVIRRKGLTISLARRMKAHDLARAVSLAAVGRVELGSLVTERHPLADFEDAFTGLTSRRGLKVVIAP
ncbi:MAG TPA: alcohol dehydrogenase catalytic domain-containing protein [Gaiellaceae bacterium]